MPGPPPQAGLEIALFNDTGNQPHVGCLAVADAHDRMLAGLGIRVKHRFFSNEGKKVLSTAAVSASGGLPAQLLEKIRAVDAVVVNGEGTIHHGKGRHLAAILAAAQSLGRPTYLINAVIQASAADRQTFRQLEDLTVRDAFSSRYLKRLRIPHRLVLDSILEAQFASIPDQDFSGKIVYTDHHRARDGDVGRWLRRLAGELGPEAIYYPLRDAARRKDWRHAVANFRSARVIITARHHGVYLAGLAGVPFVALGSNSWKVEGLLALFGRKPGICAEFSSLKKQLQDAERNQSLFKEFHHFLIKHRPLSTFEKLARWSKRRPGLRAQ